MQNISVYDIEAKRLEKIADKNDATTAEIIEQLCEYLPDVCSDMGWTE